MTQSSPVAAASFTLFERYSNILQNTGDFASNVQGCTREHLLWMCETAQAQGSTWPIDKLSRWLGFVQGVLTMNGLLSVETERDFSRPLFHAAYAAQGVSTPPTVGPQEKNTLTLSADDVHLVYEILMDSDYQEEIGDTQNHPNAWALDYVHDAALRAELDARAATLGIGQ